MKYPDRVGFIDEKHRLTFGQFEQRVNQIADGLRSRLSVSKGDRICLLMETGVSYAMSLFSIARAGAIAVPLNSRLTDKELIYEIENSSSNILVTEEAFLKTSIQIRKLSQSLKQIVAFTETGPAGIITIDELRNEGCHGKLEPFYPAENELLMIMYTSGTTGFPKGAMQTHRGAVHACMLIDDLFEPKNEDRMLNVLPMFHAAGAIMSAFSAVYMGVPCVYLPKYNTERVLATIESEKISLMVHVPTVYWLMATHKELNRYDLSSLRSAIVGGAPKSNAAFENIMRKLPNVRFADTFGMTETHSMDFILTHEDLNVHMDTVGRPVPVVEVQITDKDGSICKPGTPGEIRLRGPKIMKGYWNNEAATSESIKDGWLFTGDVGKFDADGYLHVLDRIKDMINRGGENIYSVEVENALREHPAVDDAAVVGVPDAVFGEAVKAYVSLKKKATATQDEIIKHCSKLLADYKVPKYVEFLVDFPRNPTGKILKNELRGR